MPCKYANITVTPDTLEFEVDEGWKFVPPYQYIRIAKDGPGIPPHFSISIDEDWLSISPYAGEAPRNVRVGCDSPGMKAGTYIGHITVTSHVEVENPLVEVTLVVKPKLIADPAPVIPGPAELPDTEPVPDSTPPEYDFPAEVDTTESDYYVGPTPTYQPEPESWFTVLIRWLSRLLRG